MHGYILLLLLHTWKTGKDISIKSPKTTGMCSEKYTSNGVIKSKIKMFNC